MCYKQSNKMYVFELQNLLRKKKYSNFFKKCVFENVFSFTTYLQNLFIKIHPVLGKVFTYLLFFIAGFILPGEKALHISL